MPIIHRLSLLLCSLLATAAQAEDIDLSIEPVNWPESAPQEASTTVIEADQVNGEAQQHVAAQGNVVIQQGLKQTQADRVDYYSDPERVIAKGRVRYQQEGLLLFADSLNLETTNQTGQARDLRYEIKQGNRSGQGQASSLDFLGPKRYQLNEARFSTCDPNQTDWYIGASKLDLDYGRNIGVAHNSTLHFLGAPIGWMPWLDFPLDGGRKSGLLPPRIGTANNKFDISVPYYWNIAPNLDTTFTPRFMLERGTVVANELRYLTPHSNGQSNIEWLGNDQVTKRDRYGLSFNHNQRISQSISAGIRFQKVSDYAYFADFGDRLSAATQVTLPQEIWAGYSTDHWQGLLRFQRYQTLQDPVLPITPPYWREPQILIEGGQTLIGPIRLQINSEWVRFRRDTSAPSGLPSQVEGQRFHFYPSLAWDINTPYAFLRPKLGWMLSDYQLEQTANSHITRHLPIISVDSGMTFERDFTFGNTLFTQTLEPRMYYVNIPYRDQNDIPNFDTNELAFNFSQMFSENRFSGIDKVNNANQITLGLSSRFLENESGRERLRLGLGQRFYFEDQKVFLTQNQSTGSETKSDILLAASGSVNNSLRLDSYAQFNQDKGRLERGAFTLNYQPQAGHNLNLGYHYAYMQTRQADISVQWPLYKQWYGMGRALYSFKDSDQLESMAGFEYKAGCWVFRMIGQRYVVSAEQKNNRVLFELELNGLSSIGTNPLATLRDSIFGYQKSNELPSDTTAAQ